MFLCPSYTSNSAERRPDVLWETMVMWATMAMWVTMACVRRWLAPPSPVGAEWLASRMFSLLLWAPNVWPHLILWVTNGCPNRGFPFFCGRQMAGHTFSCGCRWLPPRWFPHPLNLSSHLCRPTFFVSVLFAAQSLLSVFEGGGLVFEPLPPRPPPPPPLFPTLPATSNSLRGLQLGCPL